MLRNQHFPTPVAIGVGLEIFYVDNPIGINLSTLKTFQVFSQYQAGYSLSLIGSSNSGVPDPEKYAQRILSAGVHAEFAYLVDKLDPLLTRSSLNFLDVICGPKTFAPYLPLRGRLVSDIGLFLACLERQTFSIVPASPDNFS